VLLNLAGIDTIWGTAPQADEIRKLDQQRMLRDDLFAEETTAEDLVLAQALLAERSAEDIAAALARLYRARLPSPEDIIDPGEDRGRSRGERSRERDDRTPRGAGRDDRPPSKPRKSQRDGMPEGSVWFRAAIGRRKNAEARWLLPMICRRGGVQKQDIGAIRIMDTTTEFEISARAAESFAVKIKRPDKEDSIRIEAMAEAPQAQAAPAEKRPHTPRREAREFDRDAAPSDHQRDAKAPKPQGKFQGKFHGDKPYAGKSHAGKSYAGKTDGDKPHTGKSHAGKSHVNKSRTENAPGFGKQENFKPGKRHQEKPAFAGNSRRERGPAGKPAFGKKQKKKFRD
jgi:ATP-dependent RNA helicase DeaD